MMRIPSIIRYYVQCVVILLPVYQTQALIDNQHPIATTAIRWQQARGVEKDLENLIITLEESRAFSSDENVIKKLTCIINTLTTINQQLRKVKKSSDFAQKATPDQSGFAPRTPQDKPDSLQEAYKNLIELLDEQQHIVRPSSKLIEENGPYYVAMSMKKFILDNSDIIVPEITTTTFILAISFKTIVSLCVALGYSHLTRDAFSELPLKEQSLTEENVKKIHKSLFVPRLLLMIPSTLCSYAISQTFKNRGAHSIHKVIEVVAVRIISYLATLIFLYKHHALLQHPTITSVLLQVITTLIMARFFTKPETKDLKLLLDITAFISYFCSPNSMSPLERCLDGCANLCIDQLPKMIINKITLPTMFVGKNRKRVILDIIQLLLDASKQFVIERSL